MQKHLWIYGHVSTEHEPDKSGDAETRHAELIIELNGLDHHQRLDRLKKLKIDFWRMVE